MEEQLLSKFSLFSGNEFFVVDWALLLGRVWLDNSPTFATRNFVIAPHFSTPFRFFPLDDNNGTAKTFLKTWNYFWSKLSFWYNWFHEKRYLALSLWTEIWFDEIYDVSSTQCGKMKNLLSPKKIFRQINYLVISLVKALLSRNFCQKSVRVNFCNFHTV